VAAPVCCWRVSRGRDGRREPAHKLLCGCIEAGNGAERGQEEWKKASAKGGTDLKGWIMPTFRGYNSTFRA